MITTFRHDRSEVYIYHVKGTTNFDHLLDSIDISHKSLDLLDLDFDF